MPVAVATAAWHESFQHVAGFIDRTVAVQSFMEGLDNMFGMPGLRTDTQDVYTECTHIVDFRNQVARFGRLGLDAVEDQEIFTLPGG